MERLYKYEVQKRYMSLGPMWQSVYKHRIKLGVKFLSLHTRRALFTETRKCNFFHSYSDYQSTRSLEMRS